MTELNSDIVLQVEDEDIVEVIEDADQLLARLVADGELLTGGRRARAPSHRASRRRRSLRR